MSDKKILDPWSSEIPSDYKAVMKEFGIGEITSDLLSRLPSHRLFRRNIIFAQRDLGRIVKAIEAKKEFAVLTGIKPSNFFHIGSKVVVDQINYFQSLGGKVFFCVADIEALHTNGMPPEETAGIAVDNVADIFALGIDPKKSVVYKQSENTRVLQLATACAKNVTNNMLRAVYGEHEIGHYISALIQVGDILLPQMPEHGGPKPVLVPVGIDQDPHLRLTRDIAEKHKLILPSSTYNKFMRSLSGSAKMSKSEPQNMMTLSDEPKEAAKKLMRAFTGGRNSIEEQKKLGGEPAKCVVYDFLLYLLEDDDAKLKKRFEDCRAGCIICGDCKKDVANRLVKFLESHRKKKKKYMDIAAKTLEKGAF